MDETERLRDALHRDDAARRRLCAALSPTDFATLSGCRSAPDRASPTPRRTLPADLRDFYPGEPLPPHPPDTLPWHYLGARDFTEPFYDATLARASTRPLNRLVDFLAPIDALDAFAESPAALPLRGLIFHLSRCGSTWLSRLLAHDPANLVLAEPGPVDAVLRSGRDDATRVRHLRGLAALFGRRREPDQRGLFIKLDAWHALALPLLRRAFPDTPFLFLHRDPIEILVSHRRRRGRHMVPGLIDAAWFGNGAPTDDLDAYGAWVLARIHDAARRHGTACGMLSVDYAGLRTAFPDAVARHFGLDPERARAALHGLDDRHAKHAMTGFVDDRAEKQRAADAALRRITARYLGRNPADPTPAPR